MSELDVTQHLGVRGWAGVIGGGSVQSALDQSRLYGGLVAGAHARLNQTFSMGGLAGLVQSSNTALSGSETLATSTGVAGLYGRAAFGVADIDFSLLGGAAAHHSARQVVANNTVETATRLFSSVFVAPGFGISVPVLSSDLGEIRLVTTGNYVGGLVSAYTETGSSMNLVVGSQTIGVVDARIGIEIDRPAAEGDAVTLTAKAGLLAQDNFGSASVPVTTFGSTLTVATPGGSAFGAYGGLKLDAALGNGLRLGAQLDGALRTDGVLSESAKFSLAGAF